MSRTGKTILLLIILAVGLYYFLQMPESEPYKLPSYLNVSYPTVVSKNQQFNITVKLNYTIPLDVPETIKNYISQYGDQYIIGDKLIRIIDLDQNLSLTSGRTDKNGLCRIFLTLTDNTKLKAYFEGSSLLKKSSYMFYVNVSSEPNFSLSLERSVVSVIRGRTATNRLAVTSVNGFSGTVVISVSNVQGLIINLSETQVTLYEDSKTIDITISTSETVPVGSYSVTVSAVSGVLSQSITFTVNVQEYQPLSSTITADKTSIGEGETVRFSSLVTGGVSPYTYQWFINNNAVSGGNSETLTYTFSTYGNYTVHLMVTDSEGSYAMSNKVNVTVLKGPNALLYVTASSRIDFITDGAIDEKDRDEVQKYLYKPVTNETKKYDINEDNTIDMSDFGIVNSNIGTIVSGTIYKGTEPIAISTFKGAPEYVGKFYSGTYTFTLTLITGETCTQTLTLNEGDNVWVPQLSNPWKKSGLSILQLTGNVYVDLLKFLALVCILVCVVLLIYVFKKKS